MKFYNSPSFAHVHPARVLLIAVLAALFGVMGSHTCLAAEQAHKTYFVSPAGHDTADGSRKHPFGTLLRARDAARASKGAVVTLLGGDYFQKSGLELTSADSNSIYRAEPGATVRILGGQVVTGFVPVAEPAILSRLQPDARSHVLVLDLRKAGISDFGSLRSRGFSRPIVPAQMEVFFNGKPMDIAQWPKPGMWSHIATSGALETGFGYTGDRPGTWAPSADIWVHGYWDYDWADSYEHVASIDTSRHTVVTSPPYGLYGFGAGQRFSFINVLEELTQPGEYYTDQAAGMLYFWPPGDISTGETLLSMAEQPVIKITNASGVRLEGLTIEGCRGSGIEISGGSANTVAGCTVRNTGNWGIVVSSGAGHTIAGCDIYGCGDGAISVAGGDRKTLVSANDTVENNDLHDFGRWNRTYQAGVLASGVGIRIANNRIHNAPHTAILYWGNDITVEANEVYKVCLDSGDVGAIYTGRDYTFRGDVIRNNFIHHVSGVGMAADIYMDDCVSGHQITGNVIFGENGIWLGGGRDINIDGNMFIHCNAVHFDARGTSREATWHDMIYVTMKQRLDDMKYLSPPYITRWPELAPLAKYLAGTDGVPPENDRLTNNLCVGGTWLEDSWGRAGSMLHQEGNTVTGDSSVFVDAANGDFRLKSGAPVGDDAVRHIPFDSIGLQVDKNRKSIPPREKLDWSM